MGKKFLSLPNFQNHHLNKTVIFQKSNHNRLCWGGSIQDVEHYKKKKIAPKVPSPWCSLEKYAALFLLGVAVAIFLPGTWNFLSELVNTANLFRIMKTLLKLRSSHPLQVDIYMEKIHHLWTLGISVYTIKQASKLLLLFKNCINSHSTGTI